MCYTVAKWLAMGNYPHSLAPNALECVILLPVLKLILVRQLVSESLSKNTKLVY